MVHGTPGEAECGTEEQYQFHIGMVNLYWDGQQWSLLVSIPYWDGSLFLLGTSLECRTGHGVSIPYWDGSQEGLERSGRVGRAIQYQFHIGMVHKLSQEDRAKFDELMSINSILGWFTDLFKGPAQIIAQLYPRKQAFFAVGTSIFSVIRNRESTLDNRLCHDLTYS